MLRINKKANVMSLRLVSIALVLTLSVLLSIVNPVQANPELIADIVSNGDLRGQYNLQFTELNSENYFTVQDQEKMELWKTDDTLQGATQIKSFDTSNIKFRARSGSELYFTLRARRHVSETGPHEELWRTNGTASGTELVYRFNIIEEYKEYLVVGDSVYFAAQHDQTGSGLWKTDGTQSGTVLLKEVERWIYGINNYEEYNGEVYFTVSGHELWKTDGTMTGTVLVKEISPGVKSGRSYDSVVFNGELFFVAESSETGVELWKTNGTAPGTVVLKDINPGDQSSYPISLMVLGNELFFAANDGEQGAELWKTDGTETGTFLFHDINPGAASSNPKAFGIYNNELFFSAKDNISNAVRKTNGVRIDDVVDISTHSKTMISKSGDLIFFCDYGNRLYVSSYGSANAISLGVSLRACDITEVNGEFYIYLADSSLPSNSTEFKIWKTDGTVAGISKSVLFDISQQGFVSYRSDIFDAGELAYFAKANPEQGIELWVSDGSSATMIKNLSQWKEGDHISNFLMIGSDVYLLHRYDDNGYPKASLWKSDGSASGTVLVDTYQDGVEEIVAFKDELYVEIVEIDAWGGYNPEWHKMISDSPAEYIRLYDLFGYTIWSLFNTGNELFFYGFNNQERGLFKSDGTVDGTTFLKNTGTYVFDSAVTSDAVYFTSNYGDELWKTNGTRSSTVLLNDKIDVGNSANYLTPVGNKLFYKVGNDLWVTSGEGKGTLLISRPSYGLTAFADHVYFISFDQNTGYELWRSNGTVGGTNIVSNIGKDAESSVPDNLMVVGNRLFFAANDGASGTELWFVDNMHSGAQLASDILPGSGSSWPESLANFGGDLLFFAESDVYRNGLWRYVSTTPSGTAAFGDLVWEDRDGNGKQDSNETGLSNINVQLQSCSGDELQVTTTDVDGSYMFSGLAPGNYRMRFMLPNNYTFSPEKSAGTYRLDSNANTTTGYTLCYSLTDSQERLSIDVGMIPTTPTGSGALGDFVWLDENENGKQDSNEAGIANVSIVLRTCDGYLLDVTTTNASGKFKFTNLAEGNYRMYFNLPARQHYLPPDYKFSPEKAAGNYQIDSNVNPVTGATQCYSIAKNQERLAIDAGMIPVVHVGTGEIGDHIWSDLNGDGVWDYNNESALSGVTIDLQTCDGNVIASDISDRNGFFSFFSLPAGNYQLKAHLLSGYRFSPQQAGDDFKKDSDVDPATGLTRCYTLADGQSRHAIDAGMVPGDIGSPDTINLVKGIYFTTSKKLWLRAESDAIPVGLANITATMVVNGVETDLGQVSWKADKGFYQQVFKNITVQPDSIILSSDQGDTISGVVEVR